LASQIKGGGISRGSNGVTAYDSRKAAGMDGLKTGFLYIPWLEFLE